MDSCVLTPNPYNCCVENFVHEEIQNPNLLPPEPQVGNVEYKLKIVNPSKQRFEHLVTQMNWRLREGNGAAIYEIGVKDSGTLTGLSETDMTITLQNLQQMAIKLGATMTTLKERTLETGRSTAKILVRKMLDNQTNEEIRVAVLGNADSGKSTLLGVLTQGNLDNGRGRARLNMFRHLHEIQTGRTSSISQGILGFDSEGQPVNYSYRELTTVEEICDNSKKLVTFLDLAGHRKYIKTTIQGLSGYSPHHAMLVVSSTTGAVGMAHEHLAFAVALNVPFFIVITKIDLVKPKSTIQDLECFLKQAGTRKVGFMIEKLEDVATANNVAENIVPIFCVSSVNGEGLDLLSKFLHMLPSGIGKEEQKRLEQESPEFRIDESFKAGEVPQILGGLLTKGVLAEGTDIQIGPMKDGSFQKVRVTSIHRNRVPCQLVRAGQSAAICLNCHIPNIRNGMVLVSVDEDAKSSLFFQANIRVLFHATAIYPGSRTTIHIGNIRQTAVVVDICLSKCIHTNERDSVLFKFKQHPEYISVGQRLLFREGLAKGVGEITQVFPVEVN